MKNVSIPHRYRKNMFETIEEVQVKKFQFLIGIVKTKKGRKE